MSFVTRKTYAQAYDRMSDIDAWRWGCDIAESNRFVSLAMSVDAAMLVSGETTIDIAVRVAAINYDLACNRVLGEYRLMGQAA